MIDEELLLEILKDVIPGLNAPAEALISIVGLLIGELVQSEALQAEQVREMLEFARQAFADADEKVGLAVIDRVQRILTPLLEEAS